MVYLYVPTPTQHAVPGSVTGVAAHPQQAHLVDNAAVEYGGESTAHGNWIAAHASLLPSSLSISVVIAIIIRTMIAIIIVVVVGVVVVVV